ncbi:hypothetical protein TNCT_464751 [Trichonephila clavata]|uniref:Uncharacterized protein n=1 Tax=Trichonephila clavata TaxID=2740835 RepID=A0A8X6HIB6_TRICU|nr:hypothetical protein TNCT_464751 [Trichonephila clavata]
MVQILLYRMEVNLHEAGSLKDESALQVCRDKKIWKGRFRLRIHTLLDSSVTLKILDLLDRTLRIEEICIKFIEELSFTHASSLNRNAKENCIIIYHENIDCKSKTITRFRLRSQKTGTSSFQISKQMS